MGADAGNGRLRRTLHRLTAGERELEAAALQERAEESGATPVARCVDREPVRVAGTLRSVVIRPRGGAPTLQAELYDGSGVVHLVWLGRRTIPGISPGVHLVADGRVSVYDGARTMFNPRYELRPPG